MEVELKEKKEIDNKEKRNQDNLEENNLNPENLELMSPEKNLTPSSLETWVSPLLKKLLKNYLPLTEPLNLLELSDITLENQKDSDMLNSTPLNKPMLLLLLTDKKLMEENLKLISQLKDHT